MKGPANYAIATKIQYREETRKGRPEKLLTPFGLTAVVGLKALPGTTQNVLPFADILSAALREAKMLYDAGIRSIMVQNVNDTPMYVEAGKHIVAYMSAICYAIRCALPDDCILGVSVLRDDGEAMVAVASAAELDFIRPKTYVGAVVGIDGIHGGNMNQILEMRCKLRCDVQIYADVHDRSTTPLGDVELIDACEQAIGAGLVDALNIAGKTFGESLKKIDTIKSHLPDAYIILGGGANSANLETVYAHADGISVASCLKDTGNMTGELDPTKLKTFMDAYCKLAK